MLSQKELEIFDEYPVIAAVRTPEDYEYALKSKVRICFMVGGDVFKVQDQIRRFIEKGGLVFFHMDLVEGIGKDASGIRYAKETMHIAGIQSTKTHLLKIAKKEGLITVHRLFVTDFQALKSGMNMVKDSNPDFVELTPGIVSRIVKLVKKEHDYRVISSGLITFDKDVEVLRNAGASNVVCSTRKLWNYEGK